jgi:phage terminase large subunit GpA-like protein
VKGQPVREWHKPDKARNEPLDCRNYAYAALKATNPSFKRLAEKLAAVKPTVPPELPAKPPELPTKPPELRPPVPEKPQEEPQAPAKDNPMVIRSRRVLKSNGVKGRNWAKNY